MKSMLRYLNSRSQPKTRPRELIIRTLVDSRGFYRLLILVKINNLGRRGLIIRTLIDSRGFHGLLILTEINNLGIPSSRGSRIYKKSSFSVKKGFLKYYLLSHNYPLVTIVINQLYLIITISRLYLNVDTLLSLNEKVYRRRP